MPEYWAGKLTLTWPNCPDEGAALGLGGRKSPYFWPASRAFLLQTCPDSDPAYGRETPIPVRIPYLPYMGIIRGPIQNHDVHCSRY